ncbi:hypothetical protein ANO11243_056570 [Dothideomycetidae sp. 11243]|nr:hypothetical protein ANO11243_056570 [fungal sp. No.11243]
MRAAGRDTERLLASAVEKGFGMVRSYCTFRLLEGGKGEPVEEPLGVDWREPQIAIFIAVTDLGPENGFFTRLRRGQHIAVDNFASVTFPVTGGGRGVFMGLEL